jgi:hypothetical protein
VGRTRIVGIEIEGGGAETRGISCMMLKTK